MKQLALLLTLLLCLTACTASPGEGAPETTKQETTAADETTPEVTEPEEYRIVGVYNNDHAESYVSFDGNGNCIVQVYYVHGFSRVPGTYRVEGDEIRMHLELADTMFDGYMDADHTFTIEDAEHIVIHSNYYSVTEGTEFEQTSTEPDVWETPAYDIIGYYFCENAVYSSEAAVSFPENFPYIRFYLDGDCSVNVVYPDGVTSVQGRYTILEDTIQVEMIYWFPPSPHDDVKDDLGDSISFAITDETELVIRDGFFDVGAGDSFVRGTPHYDPKGNTRIRVAWAEEDVLSEFSEYDTFTVAGAEPPVQILFSSKTGAKEFKVLALTLADTDAAGEMTFTTEELYALDELRSDCPLVVETAFYGSVPNNGISYVDWRGVTRCFAVEMSGADGSLVMWEINK